MRAGLAVTALFDAAAEGYDRARRQLVPPFDDFYGTAVEAIPYEREDAIRVLDLGAGTGLLSAFVAQAFPRARITLVDASPEMLGVARRRFADEPERFEFRVMYYAREPLSGEYEAVVSALSIHHLDGTEKRELFRKVYGVLCDGGFFVNADQVLGSTPEIEARYRETWLRQVRESGAGEEDLAAAFVRMREDKPSTLEEQEAWLEEAGFRQVDCPYKNYGFAVYGGRKQI
ncbi:MAG: class I SAM-dependent methyltransferase [Actinomycetota bacterium]|nr:class I SAM-dependent methyltransferase [Actinomycetota bacterium]